MRNLFKGILALFCSFTLLASSSLRPTQAQDTEQLVGGFIGVLNIGVSVAAPEAEIALQAASKIKDLMGMLGFFDKPDPLKQVNERLEALRTQLSTLERNVEALKNNQRMDENLARVRQLDQKRSVIKGVLIQLQDRPTDMSIKDRMLSDVQNVCDDFIKDTDLWLWSDQATRDIDVANIQDNKDIKSANEIEIVSSYLQRWNHGQPIKPGQMMDPDFRPLPAFEVYASALATWMATIDYATGGDKATVRSKYGAALQGHIDFLSVRAGWDKFKGMPPETLPEKLISHIRSYYVTLHPQPDANRQCDIAEYVEDGFTRNVSHVGKNITYIAGNNSDLCGPGKLVNYESGEEEKLERGYGLDAMELYVKKLSHLRDQGTIREQFIGTFDTTTVPDESNILYTVSSDGTLTWHEHVMQYVRGTKTIDKHVWRPEKIIGSGWAGVMHDLEPAGTLGIYAIQDDGTMYWWRHNGALNGTADWSKPVLVGTTWNQYTQIFTMGEGVIYGIRPDGILVWYKHNGYKHAQGGAAEWGPILEVGRGWSGFKAVFGGGKGVIYVVTNDGKLMWYHHKAYSDAVAMPKPGAYRGDVRRWNDSWEGPKQVGEGWGQSTKLFSPGNGDIYEVRPNGDLMYYKHLGWQDGSYRWDEGSQRKIAGGWDKYKFVFVRNTSGDAGSGDSAVDVVVH